MKSTKFLSIVIIPDGGGRTFRSRISYSMLSFLSIVFVLLVGLIVYLSFQFGNILMQALKGMRAIERVQSLEMELTKIERLEREIAQLKDVKNQIEGMLGVIHSPGSQSQGAKGSTRPSMWPVKGKVTKEYSIEHPGLDIAVPEGSSIWSTADGVVRTAGWDEWLGFMVEIEHEDGFKTVYGHNSQVLVEKGSKVKRGDVIAFSGSSGRSTAPHLHYEVLQKGRNVDPRKYLKKGE
jgi:murein DD-endopeptidase MepM/ murein hydrolase activator NlpD